ncbi:type II toxin-antitoxin system MqsA family antitoxin [Methylomonas sp. SURF-2]|uniref:Type II toxin-antitoxin system MqsA family antitoxin n=1 Tax=Methylomonas subterranea TaxID=2952225 RepID=A0ABT1TJ46_9GAMM|nr:type II toxin-antitoxin system MqsA family antitoxin [Methylomonas sp. SURF-2]MCQ8105465.1 type II toxin-antitoxin system MqsA family antitoxin [Methylomonas sp. SURF-2]
MTEQCSFCGHKHLSHKLTRYLHQQGDELLIIDDVPCLECDFCGEQYFEAAVLKAIEAEHLAIINHQKKPTWIKPVAVESFAALSR